MKSGKNSDWKNFGIRMKNLLRLDSAKKSVLVLIDQGLVSVANFVTGLLIGRVCTKEEFGFYMLGFSIVVFIMNIQGFLITTPYTIHSPRLKATDLARYSGSTLVHQLAFSMLSILFLLIFAVFLFFDFGPQGFLPIVKSLIFAIGFILLWDYARRFCMAALKIKTALFLDCSVLILQVGGLLMLKVSNQLSASKAFLAVGAACGFSSLLWVFAKRKEFVVGARGIISDLKHNMSTGWWIFASGLLWSFSTYLYPWLLAGFHGPASAGVWAACFGVVNLYNPIFMGMQNFLGPESPTAMPKEDSDAFSRFSFQSAKIIGIAVLPFCVALFFLGGRLVTALYGDKYAGSGLIVSVLGLNLLISVLAFVPSCTIITMGRADVDFKINVLMLIGMFSYGLWLVKSYGTLGAAMGLLIANSGCLIFRYVGYLRITSSQPQAIAFGPKSF